MDANTSPPPPQISQPKMTDIIHDEAYITLVTSDSYVIGALVLCHSLRKSLTKRVICCMVTKNIDPVKRALLAETFDVVIYVDSLDSGDTAHLELLQRPELGITFTKIHAWNLTQYNKCVFLDADTLVLRNCDAIFERHTDFAAAPDAGWPDCFNSGVFFFRPSQDTFANLHTMAMQSGSSFDGGDQGLLNSFFSDWPRRDAAARLPFTYNMTANASYGYVPAFQKFKDDVNIVHFIGQHKPWHGIPQPGPDMVNVITLVEKWWRLHDDYKSCYSESCPYKTLMGARVTRSPGPEGDMFPTTPPSMYDQRDASFSHDTRRPLAATAPMSASSSYLESSSFAEIQSKFDSSMRLPEPPSLLHIALTDDEGDHSRASSAMSGQSEDANDVDE
jgi:lipopolysaccharide biosynthesis glycosyltransferase